MTKSQKLMPIKLVNLSIFNLIEIYLKDKIIYDSSIFGLKNFNTSELLSNSFDKSGGDEFCLYEKSYRSTNYNNSIGLKIYYENGVIIGNGLDVGGERIATILKNINSNINNSIKKLEIYMDESFSDGYLVINSTIILWFVKTAKDRRSKFILRKISTVFSFDSEWSNKFFAEIKSIKKNNIQIHSKSLAHKKFRKNLAVKELVVSTSNLPNQAMLSQATA